MGGANSGSVEDERVHFPGTRGPLLDAAENVLPSAAPKENAVAFQDDREAARPFLARLTEALELEWERGTAFLFLPILLAGGAFVYFGLPSEPTLPALALAVAIPAACAWVARSRFALSRLLLAILVFGLGLLAAKLETIRASTTMMGGEMSTRLTGRVAVVENQASGRVRYTVDVISTERPVLRHVPARIRVTARRPAEPILAGEVVTGVVRLRPPSGPVFPGGYDFSFESYFDSIGANGFFLVGPERSSAQDPPPLHVRLAAAIENLRDRLAERIARAVGGAEGQIAAALITGVRAGIPEEVNESLRRTGLAHVLSISGLHMALVAGTMLFGLRAGFALFPGFASRYPTKKFAAVAALAAVTLYVLISGGEVAARRSFIMIAVMLVAILFDRAAITMRNLAISALIVILVSPHEVVGPSFQMSFAATAALIAAYGFWSERRAKRQRRPPRRPSPVTAVLLTMLGYGAGLAATSIIAGLASGLYGAWHFQRVAPLGLFANLGAMPFVSVMVMPFGLIAALLTPFGLDYYPLQVMGWGLEAMLAVSAFLADRSSLDVVGALDVWAVGLCTAGFVLLTLFQTRLRLTGLPLLLAGCIGLVFPDRPAVYLDEGGTLAGVVTPEGLATNMPRPARFVSQTWQRAAGAAQIIGPEQGGAEITARRFACAGDTCRITEPSGALIVTAATGDAASRHCEGAALIFITDATARNPCRRDQARVVTARDVALRGSAAVYLNGSSGERTRTEVVHSIGYPTRPWHRERRFSRAARGMAPYVRAERPRRIEPTFPPPAGVPGTGTDAVSTGVSVQRDGPEP